VTSLTLGGGKPHLVYVGEKRTFLPRNRKGETSPEKGPPELTEKNSPSNSMEKMLDQKWVEKVSKSKKKSSDKKKRTTFSAGSKKKTSVRTKAPWKALLHQVGTIGGKGQH